MLSTRLDIELTRRLDFIFEYRGQVTHGRLAGKASSTAIVAPAKKIREQPVIKCAENAKAILPNERLGFGGQF